MRGSKPTDTLRTLPERAFRLRARLIAVGLCAVCFAGLIGRLFWLQLCTGGFQKVEVVVFLIFHTKRAPFWP